MKLLTKELLNRFAAVGCQDGKGDAAIVIAKYFHAMSDYTFYATEYNPDDRCFFGMVNGELGYTSLDEMEGVRVRGLGIERDLYFSETTIGAMREKGQ
jgi:hypothetical protein